MLLLFLHSTSFDMPYCHSLFSICLLTSPFISFLTESLFSGMLFNLCMFVGIFTSCLWVFLLPFCGWFITSKHAVGEYAWCALSLVKLASFVSQHMLYLWDCSTCTGEKCVIWCYGMKGSVNVNYVHWSKVSFYGQYFFIDFLFGWFI